MRSFAKISPKFWIGSTGRKICKLDANTKIIALYLMTNPHASMIGVYYLPISYIAHDIGISFDEASVGINALCDLDFCSFDKNYEYIWVHNMALYQISNQLKENDKRVIAIQEKFDDLPELYFIKEFFNKYQQLFHLHNSKQLESSNKDEISLSSNQYNNTNISQEIESVFEHWKLVMQHPNAKLDAKRKTIITKALKSGYEVEQLCNAITGCSYTPHNMGDNDRGQRYDGLHIILRDGDQIDRFIHNYHNPPKPLSAAERRTKANIHNLQCWLNETDNEDKPDAF